MDLHVSNLRTVEPFTTKDGSEIRELVGPSWTPAEKQSLAEATIPAGGATVEHFHRVTEELYYVVEGRARMRLGERERELAVGDCVVIPPGMRHKIWSTGDAALRILCCCAPAYTHEDTVLTEEQL